MPTKPDHCPRCNYDLRGQIAAWDGSCPLTMRCPECGSSFYTGDLLGKRWPIEYVPMRSLSGCAALWIAFWLGALLIGALAVVLTKWGTP